MRGQRRTTIIVVGGALAIASVGYGLGSQAGDGTAIADNNSSEQDGGGTNRGGAPPLRFERGAPPGFSALADKLGVSTNELMGAMRDFHDRHDSDRRDEFAAKLAKALGIPASKVNGAFEALHRRHEDRFAAKLAAALGVDTAKVTAALDKLKGGEPGPPDEFAQKLAGELGVSVSQVRSALMEIRPFDGPGHEHPGRPMPLRQLAKRLGVSRADLRDAFAKLRSSAEHDWRQEHRREQAALARFLADRFNLDVSKVQDALTAVAPPLRSPDRRPGDHPAAI
jgi:transcriptional regulator with XRE-family HTH domain